MFADDGPVVCISIHALREESDKITDSASPSNLISIHALREESDMAQRFQLVSPTFQSTLSVRRATTAGIQGRQCHVISIHALREESDLLSPPKLTHSLKFQSTLSVRRATAAYQRISKAAKFQSTLSVRRATKQARHVEP